MKNFNEHLIDIPSIFWPLNEQQPFKECTNCHISLLDGNQDYMIEKAFRQYSGYKAMDVVFEFAICLPCAEKMRNDLSAESVERIKQYMFKHANFVKNSRLEQLNKPFDAEAWLERCVITNKHRDELSEYQIFGQCRGKSLVFSIMPYMISGEAMDEMAMLLSAKSIGEMNRFKKINFGIPPELKDLLKDQPFAIF